MTTGQPRPIQVRSEPQPGDLGLVTRQHGLLYASEYGFDWQFEAYVAASLAEFAGQYRPERDRLWIAERDGEFAGSVGVLGREGGEAQLRWLLVHPDARGQGLGGQLVGNVIDFCHAAGYSNIYLWTVDVLYAAARLYRSAGFRKTETKPQTALWGVKLSEERYDLPLDRTDQR